MPAHSTGVQRGAESTCEPFLGDTGWLRSPALSGDQS